MTDSKNNQSLLPVYLITGEDALKRDAVMKRLRTRLSSMGDLSFNSEVFIAFLALLYCAFVLIKYMKAQSQR